jgi:hypothetical protein
VYLRVRPKVLQMGHEMDHPMMPQDSMPMDSMPGMHMPRDSMPREHTPHDSMPGMHMPMDSARPVEPDRSSKRGANDLVPGDAYCWERSRDDQWMALMVHPSTFRVRTIDSAPVEFTVLP